MALDSYIVVNGIFSIIVVLFSFLVGLTILAKYKKYKQKTLIYVGFTSIGYYAAWWASSISFLIALFNDIGLQDFPQIYFIIGGILTSPTLIVWMLALESLMEKKNKKREALIVILTIEAIIIELMFLIVGFIIPPLLGHLESPVDFNSGPLGFIVMANFSIISLIFTTYFSIKSMKSPVPEIQLKGIIILISSIIFGISAFADVVLPLNLIWLTIVRLFLILSSFLFYCGFILPNFVKKIFLK